jgi:hypothetical protein
VGTKELSRAEPRANASLRAADRRISQEITDASIILPTSPTSRERREGTGSIPERVRRESSGRSLRSELDKRKKKEAKMARSRSLTDRNRCSLDAYYTGDSPPAAEDSSPLEPIVAPIAQLK